MVNSQFNHAKIRNVLQMPYKNNNYQLLLFTKRFLFLHPQWVVSSVGLEHYLDRVGVTGSNPVQPTKAVGFDRLFLLDEAPHKNECRAAKIKKAPSRSLSQECQSHRS